MSARPAPIPSALAVAHYREGETCQQIGRRYGVGTATVWRRLRDAGEPRRKPNSKVLRHQTARAA